MAKKQSSQAGENDYQLAESLDQLTARLQLVANCLGFLVVRFSDYRKKTDTERIPFLNSLGFDRNDIAAILGTTPNTVSVRLSEFRASKKRKKSTAEED
jgi:CRP-like cAMP-binding protein